MLLVVLHVLEAFLIKLSERRVRGSGRKWLVIVERVIEMAAGNTFLENATNKRQV